MSVHTASVRVALDDELNNWLERNAVEEGVSKSAWVGNLLRGLKAKTEAELKTSEQFRADMDCAERVLRQATIPPGGRIKFAVGDFRRSGVTFYFDPTGEDKEEEEYAGLSIIVQHPDRTEEVLAYILNGRVVARN